MSTDKLIDDVAKAIFLWSSDDIPPEWESVPETLKIRLRKQAQAVIRVSGVLEMREAFQSLLLSAKLLHQNAEGCAVNHYGSDFELYGTPGWLADAHADIERAQIVFSNTHEPEKVETC